VQYWVNGEDENYERELERVSRFGGVPPAPMSPSDVAGVVLLGRHSGCAVDVRHCGLRAVVAMRISKAQLLTTKAISHSRLNVQQLSFRILN
jgi:hypothetical protein